MSDLDTNISVLKDKVYEFSKERGWGEAHNPKNLSMSIAIEAAELMEIFQWLDIEKSNKIMSSDEFEHVKEELADVLIYCMSFANTLNIDISEAIEDKLEKNGLKYPLK